MFTLPNNVYLRRVSIAVLVVFGTLLLLEALTRMGMFLVKPELSHSAQFDQKQWIAEHPTEQEKEDKTLILLGNSQIKYALYPEAIALGLNQNILNLGSDAATTDMNLYLLKKAMASGYDVSGVVLNINPLSFSKTHREHPELTAQKTFNKSFTGKCIVKQPEHFVDLFDCRLQQFSILYRYRSWLNRKRDDMGRATLKPELIYQGRRYNVTATEFSPNGWAVGYRVYQPEKFESMFSHPLELDPELKPVLENFNYEWDTTSIDEMVAFCKEKEIPLTLVWLPRNPLWFKAHAFFNITPDDEKNILNQVISYSNDKQINFIDMHNMPLPHTDYYDSNHQNVIGALKVTEAFTQTYQKQLEAND